MALTATEEALLRDLLAKQAQLIALANNETTITAKLGSTKATIDDLTAASNVTDADLMILRQGGVDKKLPVSVVKSDLVDLSSYAPIASPALTDTPTAPTAAAGTSTTQIATTAFVKAEAAAVATALSLPTGSLIYYAGSVAPAGYLEANGALLSRTTYAALFAAIGIIYHAGDGSTTFGLPDLRSEFIRGWDHGRGLDAGRLIGSWQGDAIRNITGEYKQYPFGLKSPSPKGAFASTTQDSSVAQQQGGASQGDGTVRFDASKVVPTANENRPRNVAALICIKY